MGRVGVLLRVIAAVGGTLFFPLEARAQAAEDPESAPPEAAAEADANARWATEKRAVRLGHDGLALYEASRWNEAHDRFQAADRLVHSPVFLLYMARCRRNAGKLIEAEERFARLSHERVPDDAPAAWHGAIADADAELIALRRSIPRIVVVLQGAPDTRIHLDGRELPSSSLGKALKVDPGRHSIVARDSKARRVVRSFHVEKGQPTTTLSLSFDAAADRRRRDKKVSDSASVWRTAGFVLLGVGAAGIGVGIGAGVVNASRDDDGDDWGAWSTTGLVAGGAVAGAGVLLLVLNPNSAGASGD